MSTLTSVGTLTITTCFCGIKHAVPTELYDHQLRQHHDGKATTGIYCPVGHKWHFSGESDAKRLRRQLDQKEQQLARERAWADQEKARLRDSAAKAENGRRAEKAAKTRIKNRIAKGSLPLLQSIVWNWRFAAALGNQAS